MKKIILTSFIIFLVLFLIKPFIAHFGFSMHFRNATALISHLEKYKKICGRYPSTEEGLKTLVKEGECSSFNSFRNPNLKLSNDFRYNYDYEYLPEDENYKIKSKSFIGSEELSGKDYR